MKVFFDPVGKIARRGTGTVGGKERLFEAFSKCKDIKEFTKEVSKEYHYFGCGHPKDLDRPFPQLAGYSFMSGPNFKVDIYTRRGEGVRLEFPMSSLAEKIWALIENDNY